MREGAESCWRIEVANHSVEEERGRHMQMLSQSAAELSCASGRGQNHNIKSRSVQVCVLVFFSTPAHVGGATVQIVKTQCQSSEVVRGGA